MIFTSDSAFTRGHRILPRLSAIVFSLLLFTGLGATEDGVKSQLDVQTSLEKSDAANAYRILFIGDSITKHGTNAAIVKKLGWDHEAGMAASEESKDYAHVFAAELQGLLPDRKVELFYHTLGGSGTVAQRLAAVDQVAVVEPHLVIVQLGEHEKETDGLDSLRSNYRKLLTAFQTQGTPPRVIAVGPWSPILGNSNSRYNGWPGQVEDAMRGICEELKVPFVSVRELADDPVNFGWGESGGVRWHPNDSGHAGYASKILSAYKQRLLH